MSTARPILFSGPMVRAILENRKTQTRRIVKPQWSADVDEVSERPALDPFLKCVVSGHSGEWEDDHGLDERRRCPYGKPGDRLWVRETWVTAGDRKNGRIEDTQYRADEDDDAVTWFPSIFMPRWASRITLEVTAVRVERLQAISEEDAKAEGLKALTKDGTLFKYGIPDSDGLPGNDDTGWHWKDWSSDPRQAYRRLWESINGPGSWAANPWVWVVEFRRVEESR